MPKEHTFHEFRIESDIPWDYEDVEAYLRSNGGIFDHAGTGEEEADGMDLVLVRIALTPKSDPDKLDALLAKYEPPDAPDTRMRKRLRRRVKQLKRRTQAERQTVPLTEDDLLDLAILLGMDK